MNLLLKNTVISGLLFAALFAGCTAASAQTAKKGHTAAAPGFKKTGGIRYKVVRHGTGRKAVLGDIAEFNIRAKVDTLVLSDSYDKDDIPADRVEEPKSHGMWQAVLPLVSAGDSLLIEVSCDTLLKNVPPGQDDLPEWLKKGKKVVINLSVMALYSLDEYKATLETRAAARTVTDDKTLEDYFTKNNIHAQKTASGLFYTIDKEGTGDKIKEGDTAVVNYTGRTMDGNIFDSNVDTTFEGGHHTEPFEFVPGTGNVIKGWDEGVLLLKKGSKAVLYIPSPLAYGPQSPAPVIPENAILMFNLEILNVKPAAN